MSFDVARAFAIAATLVVAGCDEEGAEFCPDTGESLSFSAALYIGGSVEWGEFVQYELGARYLYVADSGHYWVSDWRATGATLAGWWDPDEAAAVRSRLSVADWPSLAGVWHGDAIGGGTLELEHAGAVVRCTGACLGENVTPVLRSTSTGLQELVRRDTAAARPVGGPLRVAAVRQMPAQIGLHPVYIDWDFEPALSDFETRQEEGASVRVVTVTGTDADRLRRARVRAIAEAGARGGYTLFARTWRSGVVYRIFMRDTLPFEASDGTVALPRCPQSAASASRD